MNTLWTVSNQDRRLGTTVDRALAYLFVRELLPWEDHEHSLLGLSKSDEQIKTLGMSNYEGRPIVRLS